MQQYPAPSQAGPQAYFLSVCTVGAGHVQPLLPDGLTVESLHDGHLGASCFPHC